MLTGGCFCGAIRYEARGTPFHESNCHCSICRRTTGAPFVTWFAAMLFAVIPIRNFLPGSPPPGAWIDQALVIWVLIALVGAMALYMVTWYRQSD